MSGGPYINPDLDKRQKKVRNRLLLKSKKAKIYEKKIQKKYHKVLRENDFVRKHEVFIEKLDATDKAWDCSHKVVTYQNAIWRKKAYINMKIAKKQEKHEKK